MYRTIHTGGPDLLRDALVSSGYGWQLAPHSMRGQAASSPNVVYRPFSDQPFAFGLCLRRHRGRSAPLLQRFVEICRRLRQPGTDYLNTR